MNPECISRVQRLFNTIRDTATDVFTIETREEEGLTKLRYVKLDLRNTEVKSMIDEKEGVCITLSIPLKEVDK